MAMTFKTGIDINLNAMGSFGDINAKGRRDTIVMNDSQTISSGGKLNPLATKLTRSATTIAANNEVRTALLKSLGEAFGVSENHMGKPDDGKFVFSSDFLKQLKDRLGDSLKFKDFGIDENQGGAVSSGKPLTERRMTAINKRLSSLRGEAFTEATGQERTTLKKWAIQGNLLAQHFDPKNTSTNAFSNFVWDFAYAFETKFQTQMDADAQSIVNEIGRDSKFQHELYKFYKSARADFRKCQTGADVEAFLKRIDEETKKRIGKFLDKCITVSVEDILAADFAYEGNRKLIPGIEQ